MGFEITSLNRSKGHVIFVDNFNNSKSWSYLLLVYCIGVAATHQKLILSFATL